MGRAFGVAQEEEETRSYPIEAVLTGDVGPGLHELAVPEGSIADGTAIVALDLPAEVLVVLLHRGDHRVVPEGRTIVRAGDTLLVLAEGDDLAGMHRLLEPR
jgi:cell volume regulation protein A